MTPIFYGRIFVRSFRSDGELRGATGLVVTGTDAQSPIWFPLIRWATVFGAQPLNLQGDWHTGNRRGGVGVHEPTENLYPNAELVPWRYL